MSFHLSDGGNSRLVKNAEVEMAMKSLLATSIGNTFVIQPFLTHTHTHTHTPIYIYIERERDRQTDRQTVCVCVCM